MGGERGRGGEGEGGLGGCAFGGGRRQGGKGGGSFFSHFGGRAEGVGRGGGGDWHWRLKGRGVWVVGLSFPRPFFGFLFRFLGFGVVESALVWTSEKHPVFSNHKKPLILVCNKTKINSQLDTTRQISTL